MPLSEAHAGRSYPPTSAYEITAAKISWSSRPPLEMMVLPTAAIRHWYPTLVATLAFAWDQMFADPDLELELAAHHPQTSGSPMFVPCAPVIG